MNIIIFGATGGTGRALVQQALEQQHTVTAFARDPAKVRTTHKNLRVANGNILDYHSVKAALVNQDAALSALGVRPPVGVVVLVAIAMAAAGFGLVLHNADLSGVAAALLILSLARPAPEAE